MRDKVLILLFVASLVTTPCFATTYYISTSGKDRNSGTSITAPWQHLSKIASSVSAGDTVYLKRGDTWTGAFENGGENGLIYIYNRSNITIDAYGSGNKPIIDRTSETDPSPVSLYPDYTCVEIRGTSSNVSINNLDLRGAANTAVLYINAAPTTVISDCDLQGSGWPAEALAVISTRTTVRNCFFDTQTGNSLGYGKTIEFRYDDGSIVRGCTFYGIAIDGAVRYSNEANNGIIEGNYFYHPETRRSYPDNLCWAIVVRSQSGGTVIIRNNVIDLTNNGSLSGTNLRAMAFWGDSGPVTRKIFNNTMISDGVGEAIVGAGSTCYVYNNIFYDFEKGLNNANSGTHLKNNNFYGVGRKYDESPGSESGSQTSDPKLQNDKMDTGVTGAQLQSDSPCINAGVGTDVDLDIPTVDWSGSIRDANIDIGAFEFGAGPDPVPPSPPTGLIIVD